MDELIEAAAVESAEVRTQIEALMAIASKYDGAAPTAGGGGGGAAVKNPASSGKFATPASSGRRLSSASGGGIGQYRPPRVGAPLPVTPSYSMAPNRPPLQPRTASPQQQQQQRISRAPPPRSAAQPPRRAAPPPRSRSPAPPAPPPARPPSPRVTESPPERPPPSLPPPPSHYQEQQPPPQPSVRPPQPPQPPAASAWVPASRNLMPRASSPRGGGSSARGGRRSAPEMCYVTGEGLEEATIRAEAFFTVHACDRHGEPARGGGERFRVVFRGRSAPQWTLRDNGDGTYLGSYTASVSGDYEMNITLDGVAIRGSPFRLLVKAGIAKPELCEARGEGLSRVRAGERARVYVRAVDTLGVPKASGGDAFVCAIHGPVDPSVPDAGALALAPQKELRLADQRNGSYACSYTLYQAGHYVLTLREETTNEMIGGSPFRVDVETGPLHAPSCTLIPIDPTCTAVAGEVAMVDVGLYDAHGNALPHEVARHLRVRFATADPPPPDSHHHQQTPQRGGGGGRSSLLSPKGGFGPSLSSATAASPSGEVDWQEGAPLPTAAAGGGAPPSRSSAPPPMVSDRSPAATLGVAECKLKPVDINGFRVTRLLFRPTRAGQLRVGVMLGEEALGGQHLSWAVEAAESHADGCVVRGDGSRTCVAGEAASFSVFTRDRFGNLVAQGGAALSAEIRGKHSSPVAAHTLDMRNGEYRLSYTASVGGVHELHVFADGRPILGSPFTLKVHAARTIASKSELDTTQLAGARVGVPAAFTIIGYDRHKNRALRGGDGFRALLRPPDGAPLDVRLDDNGDGTYTGHIECRATGTHHLEALLEDAPLPQSPFALTVEAGPSQARFSNASASFLRRQGGSYPREEYNAIDIGDGRDGYAPPSAAASPTQRALYAGEEGFIDLTASDVDGNVAPSAAADWHVHLRPDPLPTGGDGHSQVPQPAVEPGRGGECVARVRVRQAGLYSCVVTLHGEEVNGSPFALEVTPGEVDAASSGPDPDGVPRGVAGQEGRIILHCRDRHGNGVGHGGERLAVQLRCPANGLAQRAAVADQGDGSYLVRFRPQLATEHEVHAWLLQRGNSMPDGRPGAEMAPVPLGGSPYILHVSPGALSCGMSGAESEPAFGPRGVSGRGGGGGGGEGGARGGAGAGGSSSSDAPKKTLHVTAGSRGAVYLQLRDAHGNPRPPSGERFTAILERFREPAHRHTFQEDLYGRDAQRALANEEVAERDHAEALAAAVREAIAAPTNSLPDQQHPLPRPEVEAFADGRVKVGFLASKVETLLLHVAVTNSGGGETPLRGSPFTVEVQAGATSARRCQAFGDALHHATVRQPTSFIILSRDAHGNRRRVGADRFAVSFIGPCNPVARVHDRGDGTYRVTYQAAVSGQCTMAIMKDRQHIAGSPFKLNVSRYEPRVGTASSMKR